MVMMEAPFCHLAGGAEMVGFDRYEAKLEQG
jgi:hypothetical protein